MSTQTTRWNLATRLARDMALPCKLRCDVELSVLEGVREDQHICIPTEKSLAVLLNI